MNDDLDDSDSRGMAGALKALLEVSDDPVLRNDWPAPSAVLSHADYEEIIKIAWRHQFAEDRSQFRRQIREVCDRVLPEIVAERERQQ